MYTSIKLSKLMFGPLCNNLCRVIFCMMQSTGPLYVESTISVVIQEPSVFTLSRAIECCLPSKDWSLSFNNDAFYLLFVFIDPVYNCHM